MTPFVAELLGTMFILILGRQGALGNARRGAVVFVIVDLYGDVTVVCSHETFEPKLMTDFANFFLDFKR